MEPTFAGLSSFGNEIETDEARHRRH